MTREDSKKIQVAIDQDLSDLIPGFLDNRRQDLGQIREALGTGNFDDIRRIGHSMKGSGGGYGFEQISQLGQRIENAALDRDTGGIEQAANDLAFFLEQVEVVYVQDPEENTP